MLLWVGFAVLTAVVLAAVLAPLARPVRHDEAAESGTLAVYRHQLGEIEADRARGVMDAGEAEAARLEISRRMLNAAPADVSAAPAAAPGRARPIAFAVAALVPLLTLAVYLTHGSPDLPSFPMAARPKSPLQSAQFDSLIVKVEERLRAHPEDGEGWDVIAPVYFKLERFRDAANAYANAARLKGETVKRLAGFVEASVFASDGIVTEDARIACQKILKLEPGRHEARFWLALAKEQDGRFADALADYKQILADAPADAPWRRPLTERVEAVSARIAAVEKGGAPGPSASDMAAAQKLPPEQRAQMIAQMVDGLAQRLKREGKDLSGWLRLVNAYVVLDRKEEARAALADARKNFGGDDSALGELDVLAKRLGLGS